MFQPLVQGAAASTAQAATESYNPTYEPLRHMLFGSLSAVQATIKHLHKLNYAEPNDWSKPIGTGQGNEVVVVLIKRVRVV
ncbi:MAG: hypothetical protein ACFBSF_19525 [Leptolyngbyaceae cyanobacterium]